MKRSLEYFKVFDGPSNLDLLKFLEESLKFKKKLSKVQQIQGEEFE